MIIKGQKNYKDILFVISTVSGSGIEFFRKFVQRKAVSTASNSAAADSCKDCQNQFRKINNLKQIL